MTFLIVSFITHIGSAKCSAVSVRNCISVAIVEWGDGVCDRENAVSKSLSVSLSGEMICGGGMGNGGGDSSLGCSTVVVSSLVSVIEMTGVVGVDMVVIFVRTAVFLSK